MFVVAPPRSIYPTPQRVPPPHNGEEVHSGCPSRYGSFTRTKRESFWLLFLFGSAWRVYSQFPIQYMDRRDTYWTIVGTCSRHVLWRVLCKMCCECLSIACMLSHKKRNFVHLFLIIFLLMLSFKW